MPQVERIVLNTMMRHKDPPGPAFFNGMGSVASRVLNDLTERRVPTKPSSKGQDRNNKPRGFQCLGPAVVEHLLRMAQVREGRP